MPRVFTNRICDMPQYLKEVVHKEQIRSIYSFAVLSKDGLSSLKRSMAIVHLSISCDLFAVNDVGLLNLL